MSAFCHIYGHIPRKFFSSLQAPLILHLIHHFYLFLQQPENHFALGLDINCPEINDFYSSALQFLSTHLLTLSYSGKSTATVISKHLQITMAQL